MSTNVYIGARYVPIFDGDWDNTKVYEPLTIVNYNGGSYTSKRAVPAGTLPTNTSYWALTGNYNGQIAALQNRVANIETELSTTKINKVIMIGDSYAGTSDWNTKLTTSLGLSASDVTYSNEGSTGFTRDKSEYGSTNNGFLRLLNNAIATLSTDDKTKVSHVIVIGGVNDRISYPDSSGVTNIMNEIGNFITTMHNNLPNAILYLGFCGMIIEGVYSGSGNIFDLLFTESAYKRGSRSLYARYMNSLKYALATPYYETMCSDSNGLMKSDGLHPTTNGGNQIAWLASHTIFGNDMIINTPKFSSTITITFADNTTVQRAFEQYTEEYDYHCQLGYSSVSGLNIPVASGDKFKMQQIASFPIPRSTYFNQHHRIQETCIAIFQQGHRQNMTVMFDYYHDTCTMYMFAPVDDDVLQQINYIRYTPMVCNAYSK